MKRITVEDGPIENLQAVLLLAAAAVMSIYSFKYAKKTSRLLFIVTLIMAFGLFIMAGEEISWGQRIFNIESSEFFVENNLQNETNLHNLNSIPSTLIVSVGGFILLSLLPVIYQIFKQNSAWKRLGSMSVLMPDKWIIIFSIFATFVVTPAGHSGFLPKTAILLLILYFVFIFVRDKYTRHHKFFIMSTVLAMIFTYYYLNYVFIMPIDALNMVSEIRELILYMGIMSYLSSMLLRKD